MSDPIRDAAIEAAAKHKFERDAGDDWAALTADGKTDERHDVTPLVDAVLAVAGPALRAEALRDAAEAMPDFNGTVRLGACQSCVGNTVSDVEGWLEDRADAEDPPKFNKGGKLNGPVPFEPDNGYIIPKRRPDAEEGA